VTLKYNNSTGIEVYEHFILQEAGYVPCIPLTRISSEISLFHWSSPVMLCRLDDKLENEFETDMTDSYSIVVWFGVSHLLHVHDTDVFERVSKNEPP
jgi:hypothetical protein